MSQELPNVGVGCNSAGPLARFFEDQATALLVHVSAHGLDRQIIAEAADLITCAKFLWKCSERQEGSK